MWKLFSLSKSIWNVSKLHLKYFQFRTLLSNQNQIKVIQVFFHRFACLKNLVAICFKLSEMFAMFQNLKSRKNWAPDAFPNLKNQRSESPLRSVLDNINRKIQCQEHFNVTKYNLNIGSFKWMVSSACQFFLGAFSNLQLFLETVTRFRIYCFVYWNKHEYIFREHPKSRLQYCRQHE